MSKEVAKELEKSKKKGEKKKRKDKDSYYTEEDEDDLAYSVVEDEKEVYSDSNLDDDEFFD